MISGRKDNSPEVVLKLAALNQAAWAMNSILDPDQLLDTILSLVEDVFALDTCAILLYDPEENVLTIRAARGYQTDVVKSFRGTKGQGITGMVVQTGDPLLINDVRQWKGYIEGVKGARSEMAAPLRLDNEIIGVLDAESRKPNAFLESDLDLFQIFANNAATAINNARLVQQIEERTRRLDKTVHELSLLNRLGRQMSANLSIDSLLKEVLHLAQKAFTFDHCAVLLREETGDDEYLAVRAALGYRQEVTRGMRIHAGQGITGRVLSSGQPILVPDVTLDPSYISGVEGGRCEMAAPLIVRDIVVGVLDAETKQPNAFNEENLRLFATFASWAASALHNADIHSRLEQKKTILDRNIEEINRMNRELRDYAARIEQANQDLKKRVHELVTLQEASRTITQSLNLTDTLNAIMRMSGDIVQSSSCAIRLLDEETQEMRSLVMDIQPEFQNPEPNQVGAEPSASSPVLRSFLGIPLKIGNRMIGYFELGSLDEGAFSEEDRRLLQAMASHAAIAIENARLFESTQQTYLETIRSLAQALEARDSYTKGHSERVTRLSLLIAEHLGLNESTRKVIQHAGLLHDIGKIGISDTILNKCRSLDDDEWTTIRNHPLFGDSILEPLKFLSEVQKIVLRHHEHFDGSGYPGQLRGEEIPLEARIIAVADAYDAMTTDRPYRKALSSADAEAEILRGMSKQFDPQVVAAFVEVLEQFHHEHPLSSRAQAADGSTPETQPIPPQP